ncbi:hypothetical protein GH714_019157 [Hevea brasiliensis]|uniref:Uncharacterized protein n=1 Tax=Hevea brasiliensis TaxID=3981 RepID=A0A6A6N307_HEVBR|nr:hypothetical protein GH714_019157 [Hevea brasiliensis]
MRQIPWQSKALRDDDFVAFFDFERVARLNKCESVGIDRSSRSIQRYVKLPNVVDEFQNSDYWSSGSLPLVSRWEAPAVGFVKINSDASVSAD